jgi:hypothetical protein
MLLLGRNAKIYFGVAELKTARNVRISAPTDEIDASCRLTVEDGWKATYPGLRNLSVEWEMLLDPDVGGYAAIRTAWLTGDVETISVDDGQATLSFQGYISDIEQGQELEGAQTFSVTAKLAYSDTPPTWA